MINPKTLILLRHGKTENGTPTGDDHARKLTPRGIEAAGIMAKYLIKNNKMPNQVLCSTATRTRETFVHLQAQFAAPLPVDYVQKLYHASSGEVMEVLSALPEKVSTLLVIGHNPGLHQLSISLAKNGDEALIDTLHVKFPTCACAIFTFDGEWSDIHTAHGTVVSFATPEMLGGGVE